MRKEGKHHRVKTQSTDDGGRTKMNRRDMLLGGTTLAAASALSSAAAVQTAQAQPAPSGRKPNILVIFGDDIGVPQISAYTMGMMGYRTPNIDRIANEGAIFTDSYGQQSCTAGRVILGQEPFRARRDLPHPFRMCAHARARNH